MGRAMTAAGLREEAQCELVALGHELLRADLWELAALDVVASLQAHAQALAAEGDHAGASGCIAQAAGVLSQLRARDPEENKRHRAIVRTAQSLGAGGLRRVS